MTKTLYYKWVHFGHFVIWHSNLFRNERKASLRVEFRYSDFT